MFFLLLVGVAKTTGRPASRWRASNSKYYTTGPFSQELEIDIVPYVKLAWQDYVSQTVQERSVMHGTISTIAGWSSPNILSALFNKPVDSAAERAQLVSYARATLGTDFLPLYSSDSLTSFQNL